MRDFFKLISNGNAVMIILGKTENKCSKTVLALFKVLENDTC